jgi:hypothetical protein
MEKKRGFSSVHLSSPSDIVKLLCPLLAPPFPGLHILSRGFLGTIAGECDQHISSSPALALLLRPGATPHLASVLPVTRPMSAR